MRIVTMMGRHFSAATIYVFWLLTIVSKKSALLPVAYAVLDVGLPAAEEARPRVVEKIPFDDRKKGHKGAELSSCILSNSGGYFTASFDSATGLNNSMEQDEWPCHTLFDFTGATSATCSWIDKKTVHAILPSANTNSLQLQPGDKITLIQTSTSVLLSPPIQAQVPVALMTVPAVVGADDELFIDLSASWGHLGRPWAKVTWMISLLDSADSNRSIDSSSSSDSKRFADDLVEYLTKHFDPVTARVTVPLYLWPETTTMSNVVSLTVSLTNYLRETSSDTRVVMIDNGRGSLGSSGDGLIASRYRSNGKAKVALASILGPRSVTIKAREGLQLDGVAQIPTIHRKNNININNDRVDQQAVSLFYSWYVDRIVNYTVREPADDLIAENRDPRRLMMVPYSLLAGEHYVVTMMVQTTDDEFNELSAVNCSVEVKVTSGRVVALLSGGDHRQVSVESELTIDAGPSYDEDLSHFDGWLLGYQWSCETTKVLSGTANDATANWSKCPFALNTATSPSLLVVPSNTLTADSIYRVQVTVISADGTRRSNPASVQITTVAAASSSLHKQTVPRVVSLIKTISNGRMNMDQQLVLPGEVVFDGSHVKASWSIVSTPTSIVPTPTSISAHPTEDVSRGPSWSWTVSNRPNITLTPLEKTMMMSIESESTSSHSFPLAMSPWTVARTPGRTYTFRLTAQSLLASSSSSPSPPTVFSEIALTGSCERIPHHIINTLCMHPLSYPSK